MIWPFKRKKKPARPTWDGVHRLKYILFEEDFGSTPQDYTTGWIWKCTCGQGSPDVRFRSSPSEAAAAHEYIAHRNLHEEISG